MTTPALAQAEALIETESNERLILEAPGAEFKIPSSGPSSPCAGCLRISPDLTKCGR